MKISTKELFGNTGLEVPPVIYGTSYLGNLYKELSWEEKFALMNKWFECTEKPLVIDTAGKYGAGLALEVIGLGLAEMDIRPEDVIISNKLGWYRVPLTGDEPTFEPGAWAGLEYDCIQTYGYEEIVRCFEQGNILMGDDYVSQLVSVHDPDEYLLTAKDPTSRDERMSEVLESYRALFDLKREGRVKAIGIGAKDWTIIRELYKHVPFDWIMFANSFTIFSHPPELVDFMEKLDADGVGIINSALFHGGFLTGGAKFDYQDLDPDSEEGRIIYSWRKDFHAVCKDHDVIPGDACLHFGLSHPAIVSIALNTSRPEKMERNAEILNRTIPPSFWETMKDRGLISANYPYL